MIHVPAHKQTDPAKAAGQIATLADYVKKVQKAELDFFNDAPLACPIGKVDGEACESCQ